MSGKRADLTTRVTTGLAGAAAAFAARKILQAGWKKVTGREPPESPEDPQVALGEAIAWVLLTGLFTSTLRLLIIRYAAGALARPDGEQPGAGRPDAMALAGTAKAMASKAKASASKAKASASRAKASASRAKAG